jgi:hypothetical protein
MHYRLFRIGPLLAAATLSLTCSLRADAPTPAAARAEIQGAYNQLCADFEARSLGSAMNFFTPDFMATDEHGKQISRDQTMRQYQDLDNTITSMQSHWNLGTVTPVPGGDVVEMDMFSNGTGRKKVLFFHVNGTFTSEMRVRDFWVDTPQGWRIKRRTILLHQTQTHPT